jgi:hypothetical protein
LDSGRTSFLTIWAVNPPEVTTLISSARPEASERCTQQGQDRNRRDFPVGIHIHEIPFPAGCERERFKLPRS